MLEEYYTPRLILKILDKSYCEEVLSFYLNNKELFERYEAARPDNFYTTDFQRACLNYEYVAAQKCANVRFWVYEASNPVKIIGTISFQNIVQSIYKSCQIGYKFDRNYHHKGYALETVINACNIIFDELNLHRIEAYTMPSNEPSKRLLINSGFEYEGLLREKALVKNRWEDHELYSLLNNNI